MKDSYQKARERTEAQRLAREFHLKASHVLATIHKLSQIGFQHPDIRCEQAILAAFVELKPSVAKSLLKRKDFSQLATAYLLAPILSQNTTPLYSIERLADLTQHFIQHLQENKDSLLNTGYPRKSFERSPWLDRHLNKLYFVKWPIFNPWVEVREPDDLPLRKPYIYSTSMERDAEGNCVYHYVWPKETANAYRKGGIIYDLGFEWDEEGPYTDGGKRVTPCSYEQAALIEGLDRCHADWFAERRERIYALKERVLRRLVKSARERDASRIWGDCLSILSDILSRTEAEYLLAMDRFYEGLMAEGQPAFPSLTRCRIYANAGLSDLLLVIAHFEKEINIGTMANTAAIMESLPPKVKPLPISYYKSFGREWRPVLDKAIKRFIGLERRERRFWSDYPSRAIQAMTEAFQDRERANPKGFNESELEKANVSFKNCMPYHSVWLETCLGMATNGLLVHGSNSLAIHATNRNAWARSEAMRPFPTPPDTRWDQVTIQFLNREDVRITLGSASARRNFAEMGFRDARKQGVQPNQLWDLLRIFAKHDGRIEWRNPLRELRGNRSKIKMRVHELRGRLRACFPGIADKDPFKPYRRVRAYETKFTLHSKEPHDTIRILK